MSNPAGKERPTGSYWEDPVYHYLSGQHRAALTAGDTDRAEQFEKLRQELVDQSLPDERYWQLDAEARAEHKRQKQERKKQGKPVNIRAAEKKAGPSLNVADLKKRIFNRQVSRENMIKALEALPPAERKATIAGLPPGLRRKLGNYLKS